MRRAATLFVIFATALLLACSEAEPPPPSAGLTPGQHRDLLIAYGLLQDSLGGESQLNLLLVLKKLTLSGPAERIEGMLKVIDETSGNLAEQLEALRKLPPSVEGKAPPSPIGDAIQASATEAGTHEMIFDGGAFNMRFLFLQAQATRMISVIAAEAAKIDPNPERQKWLKTVARDYAGYRDDLVTVVEHCQPK